MGFIKDAVGGAIDWLNTRTKKARDKDIESRAEKAVQQEQKEAVTISTAAAKEAGAIGRMEFDLSEAKKKQTTWDNRAKIAAGNKDMDALKEAVGQKQIYDKQVAELTAAIEASKGHLNEAKDLARDQKTEADAARAKADMLVARNQVANAKEDVAKAAAGIGNGESLTKLERDVIGREQEASTIGELTGVNQEAKWAKQERDAAAQAEMDKYLAAAGNGSTPPASTPTASVGGWNISN
ncbi:hypothetical protein DYH09_27115 [bacterium CPR1]|nr:hypothetical protein [bacterium CPR1]